eukprot:366104-Chlamydomonas_euryale.AAC.5
MSVMTFLALPETSAAAVVPTWGASPGARKLEKAPGSEPCISVSEGRADCVDGDSEPATPPDAVPGAIPPCIAAAVGDSTLPSTGGRVLATLGRADIGGSLPPAGERAAVAPPSDAEPSAAHPVGDTGRLEPMPDPVGLPAALGSLPTASCTSVGLRGEPPPAATPGETRPAAMRDGECGALPDAPAVAVAAAAPPPDKPSSAASSTGSLPSMAFELSEGLIWRSMAGEPRFLFTTANTATAAMTATAPPTPTPIAMAIVLLPPPSSSPAGEPVGLPVGEPVGLPVGVPVGLPVGVPVGVPMGLPEGVPVGVPVGLPGVGTTPGEPGGGALTTCAATMMAERSAADSMPASRPEVSTLIPMTSTPSALARLPSATAAARFVMRFTSCVLLAAVTAPVVELPSMPSSEPALSAMYEA